MAWSNSKIFSSYITDSLNRTAAFDLNTDALKVGLYNNTGTPSQSVASANAAYNVDQWVTANEVSQAGQWAAGGVALASVTSVFATNVFTLDAADTASGSAATLLNVFGTLLIDDSLATPVAKQAICFNYLGGTNSVTAGQFTVVWAATGIMFITL